MNYSINPESLLNRVECTYYFIYNDKNVRKGLKADTQDTICEEMANHMGAHHYGIRSGPNIRSGLKLKEEFNQTIPERINIIYIDIEEDLASLLSSRQRNMFFDEILSLEEDADTLPIVQKIIDETGEG